MHYVNNCVVKYKIYVVRTYVCSYSFSDDTLIIAAIKKK